MASAGGGSADASKVVEVNGAPCGSDHEPTSIGAEGNGDRCGIALYFDFDHLQARPRFPIPKSNAVINEPRGGDQGAIEGDGDRLNLGLMALKGPDACPCFQVPHFDSFVVRTRNGKPSVGGDLDRFYYFRMAFQGRNAFARAEVPESNLAVPMPRQRMRSRLVDGAGENVIVAVRPTFNCLQALTRIEVPQLERLVESPG